MRLRAIVVCTMQNVNPAVGTRSGLNPALGPGAVECDLWLWRRSWGRRWWCIWPHAMPGRHFLRNTKRSGSDDAGANA